MIPAIGFDSMHCKMFFDYYLNEEVNVSAQWAFVRTSDVQQCVESNAVAGIARPGVGNISRLLSPPFGNTRVMSYGTPFQYNESYS